MKRKPTSYESRSKRARRKRLRTESSEWDLGEAHEDWYRHVTSTAQDSVVDYSAQLLSSSAADAANAAFGPAAASIGFSVGGPVGATIGAQVPGFVAEAGVKYAAENFKSSSMDLFTQEKTTAKMGSTNARVINRQSGRATSSTKGKAKVASRRKTVKVAPALAKKIKKVVKGAKPYGVMQTVSDGFIGYSYGAAGTNIGDASLVLTGSFAGNTDAVTVKLPRLNGHGTQWWGKPIKYIAGGAEQFQDFADWNYFTPMRIWDAASKLFNNKNRTTPYYTQTGNLFAAQKGSDGSVVAIPAGVQGLKIEILDSDVCWDIKNTSGRAVYMDIFHCVSKLKFQDIKGLGEMINSAIADTAADADNRNPVVRFTEDSNVALTQKWQNLIQHPCFEPNQLPSFNSQWKYAKTTLFIKPGETICHKIKGPKNYTLDMSKLSNEGQEQVTKFYKPTSVKVFCRIRPDYIWAYNGIEVAGGYGPAQVVKGSTTEGDTWFTSCPISIMETETFRLYMPEITGGLTPAGVAAGVPFANSNRKNCRVLIDRRNNINQPSLAYTVIDEENPDATQDVSASSRYY